VAGLSPVVCCFRREPLWRGSCWNVKILAVTPFVKLVSLLLWQTLYICEVGSQSYGGWMRADHHQSPTGQRMFGLGHAGMHRSDRRWQESVSTTGPSPVRWPVMPLVMQHQHHLPNMGLPSDRSTHVYNCSGPERGQS
jgi:hypothetical protein